MKALMPAGHTHQSSSTAFVMELYFRCPCYMEPLLLLHPLILTFLPFLQKMRMQLHMPASSNSLPKYAVHSCTLQCNPSL